jgi:DNA-binding transcriptional MocR family regulator
MPERLAQVRRTYADRARTMGEALRRELGGALQFTQPQGGMFFWASLTGAGGAVTHAGDFAKKAIEQGVAFVPGAPFFAQNPDTSTLRLSFATADVAKIEEGVRRLKVALG